MRMWIVGIGLCALGVGMFLWIFRPVPFFPPLPENLNPVGHTNPNSSNTLTIVNWNVWMGTNGKGYFRMGDFESDDERIVRYLQQEAEFKKQNPDILFLQEVSPLPIRAERLAALLDMDVLTRGDNCGIRIGTYGMPVNLHMGIAILAKRYLHLSPMHLEDRRLQEGQLPGHSWSFCKSWAAFQWVERRVYLAASITWNNQPIVLLNTHFHATHSYESSHNSQALTTAQAEGQVSPEVAKDLAEQMQRADRIRSSAAEFLVNLTSPIQDPIILGGDLNAEPQSSPLRLLYQSGFMDITAKLPSTWAPSRNSNVQRQLEANVRLLHPISPNQRFLDTLDQSTDRKIDYVLVKNPIPGIRTEARLLFADTEMMLSDHFGISVTLRAPSAIQSSKTIAKPADSTSLF